MSSRVIVWNTKLKYRQTGGVGTSFDPGVANVRLGTHYEIDNVLKIGTLDLPPESVVLDNYDYDNATKTGTLVTGGGGAFWDEDLADHVIPGTFGYFVQKLLTFTKFLGFK